MSAVKKVKDKRMLRDLVPLNALSHEHFDEVMQKIVVEEVGEGRFLFHQGESDSRTVYLLDGEVSLISSDQSGAGSVRSGSDTSRYPLDNHRPRTCSARASRKSVIASVDSSLLDVLLSWDQSQGYEVVEINSESNDDWMTRMLQSKAFVRLHPADIQRLLRRMDSVYLRAGDTVIRQGDEGDYFYIVRSGRCTVSRKPSAEGTEVVLAELSEGDIFGEEALVSDTRRNATVNMKTDGTLMRVSKDDFIELLKNPLVRYVDYEQAIAMVDEGAVWVDVRLPGEYANGAFEDSVNIPLSALRDQASELIFNEKYIICCDTGRRSSAAAFLLSHRGFEVFVLKDGLNGGVPLAAVGHQKEDTHVERQCDRSRVDSPVAEIINFGRDHDIAESGPSPATADAGYAEGDSLAAFPSGADSGEPGAGASAVPVLHETQRGSNGTERQPAALQTLAERHANRARLAEEALEYARREKTELQRRLDELEAAQAAVCLESESRQAEEATRRQEIANLRNELQAARDREISGEQALSELRLELARSREQINALVSESEPSAEEAARLKRESEGLRQEIAAFRRQLQAQEDASSTHSTEMQDRLDAAEQRYRQVTGRCEELAAENDREAAVIRQLEQELLAQKGLFEQDARSLQDEIEHLREAEQCARREVAEAGGRMADLQSAKLAAEQELGRLRDELKGLHDQGQAETERLRSAEEELRIQLGQLRDSLQSGGSGDQQEAECAPEDGRLAVLEQHLAGAERERQELDGKLEIVSKELERLRHERDEALNSCRHMGEQLDRLTQEMAAHGNAASEEIESLKGQIEVGQARLREAERHVEQLSAQMAELSRNNEQSTEQRTRLEEEVERYRHRVAGLEIDLDQARAQLKALEDARTADKNRADEELAARKDNDRTLQDQIDRLRKTLEHANAELQQERTKAREDISHFRDELNAERKARAEERAQMAARQKELKEHLSYISQEHERELDRRPGELAQARDDAREEERARMKYVQEAQEQADRQLMALRAELEKAYEEIAHAAEAEKARQEADQALSRQQAEQAESTIRILESRLTAMERDRDIAYAKHEAAMEQCDALRAEVEVARGLIGIKRGGRVEDPAVLREQLLEARKNVEIAARLRAEAEAERDRAVRERDLAEQQFAAAQHGVVPACGTLRVPLLDEENEETAEDAGALSEGVGFRRQGMERRADPARSSSPRVSAGTSMESERRFPRRTVAAIVISGLIVAGGLIGVRSMPGAIPLLDAAGRALASIGDAGDTVNHDPGAGVADTVAARPAIDRDEDDRDAETGVKDTGSLDRAGAHKAPASAAVAQASVGRTFSDRLSDGTAGPTLVEIPAGEFAMGSGNNSLNFDERPRHKVALKAFAIGKQEVTFGEYAVFARATGRALPHDEGWGRADRPVINVSWVDAAAYVSWLSGQTGHRYRLPTEAEWEYAARAGSMTLYWWGLKPEGVVANCFNCGSEWDNRSTAPVGSFPANAYGLHDVAGNVMEWVRDCHYPNYEGAPPDGSAREEPGCTQRVVRGGAYASPLDSLRSARRLDYDQNTRIDDIGFRVVRDL
jgi:formylglycine-generating enzyme required for sulfatase activity/CRP-like cAMP-binding protein/rhodanese-related sulfurtransferase